MTTIESLHAAIASLNIVTDENELSVLRSPIETFKSSCPFAQFITRATDDGFPFASETANVLRFESGVSASGGKKLHLREIKRTPGRVLSLPTVRLQSTSRISLAFSDILDPTPLDELGPRLPVEQGRHQAILLETYLLWAILRVAQREGKVTPSGKSDVKSLIASAVSRFSGPCTVLANYADGTKVLDSPRMTYEIGDNATVALREAHPRGAVTIVAHEAERVALVRERMAPMLASSASEDEIVVSAVSDFGICAWSDAPVHVIEFGE